MRGEADFAAGHLPGSGNVPLDHWAERRAELPPRDAHVVAVADDPAEALEAGRRLSEAGYAQAAYLAAPWHALGVEPGRGPAARLWRPTPFLEEILPALPRGLALDVACGAGRDAVFLALAGYEVEGWDLDPEPLGRARAMALRHGVTLRTRVADLESEPPGIPEAAFTLVACFRFLHRPLLPHLARALAPGGHLVYETYRVGQERLGRPRRTRFLLRPGELRAAFPGLDIVRYEEPEPPGGPWTARLLARRPGCV